MQDTSSPKAHLGAAAKARAEPSCPRLHSLASPCHFPCASAGGLSLISLTLLPPHSPCSTDAVVRFPSFRVCTSISQNTAAFANGSNHSAGSSCSRQAPHLAALPQPHRVLPTGRSQDHTTLQILGAACSYCLLHLVWMGEPAPSPPTSQPPSSGLPLLPSQDLGKEQNQPVSSAASVQVSAAIFPAASHPCTHHHCTCNSSGKKVSTEVKAMKPH